MLLLLVLLLPRHSISFGRYLPACAGTIPKGWNAAGTFPRLSLLTLHYNNLTGDLPELELWPQLAVL